jgi:hypothetical protein
VFFNTRLTTASLSRAAPEALAPGDMALMGPDHVVWIRCASASPDELWMFDVQHGVIRDFRHLAHRATTHLAVRSPKYFVQLGAPTHGRPRLAHGALASTDAGLLLLVAQPRKPNDFEEQRWLDLDRWSVEPADLVVTPGAGRPVFEQWELWAVFAGGMHAGQAELVARGPGSRGHLQAVDSRH